MFFSLTPWERWDCGRVPTEPAGTLNMAPNEENTGIEGCTFYSQCSGRGKIQEQKLIAGQKEKVGTSGS